MSKSLRVVVADDHELLREALKPHLALLGDEVEVIDASTYGEVLALAPADNTNAPPCDLIILDLHMPGAPQDDMMTGLGAICTEFPEVPVVAISGLFDSATVTGALQHGARGFIPKTARGRTLISALRLVLDGEIYVPPTLVGQAGSIAAAAASKPPAPFPQLSGRETTSLRLLLQGMTNKEIARRMDLQEITVKMHLRNAYRKIGASNRIDAVRIAMEQGLAESNPAPVSMG